MCGVCVCVYECITTYNYIFCDQGIKINKNVCKMPVDVDCESVSEDQLQYSFGSYTLSLN